MVHVVENSGRQVLRALLRIAPVESCSSHQRPLNCVRLIDCAYISVRILSAASPNALMLTALTMTTRWRRMMNDSLDAINHTHIQHATDTCVTVEICIFFSSNFSSYYFLDLFHKGVVAVVVDVSEGDSNLINFLFLFSSPSIVFYLRYFISL